MREEETGREEEGRVGRRGAELLDGPARHGKVALVLVAMREGPPVHQGMVSHRRRGDEFGGWTHPNAAGGPPDIELPAALLLPHTPVIDLARRQGAIAVRLEVLRQRHPLPPGLDLAKPRGQAVDPGGRRAQAKHDAGPGRIAERRLAVGVEKRRAARRQSIEVRGAGERVSTERPNPVVLIIDDDEDDIGPVRGGGSRGGPPAQAKSQGGQNKSARETPFDWLF